MTWNTPNCRNSESERDKLPAAHGEENCNVNKKIRKAWTNALERGQYQQGRWYLRKNSHGKVKYCWLGGLREGGRNRFPDIKLQKSTSGELLNADQAFAIGISSRMQDRLSIMNDDIINRSSFKQIAKFIRKEL